MKSQTKFFFVVMIVLAMIMAGSAKMTFFEGYIAVWCSFLTLTAFSYDEAENGFAYLFTLPVSRKDYVFEKYVFGLGLTTIPFALTGVLTWVVLAVRQAVEINLAEYFLNISVMLPVAYMFLALEIPLQIKFGQHKSRVLTGVLVGCMAFCFGMMGHLSELAETAGMGAAGNISGLNKGTFMLAAVCILAVLLLSYVISCRFMERKEF